MHKGQINGNQRKISPTKLKEVLYALVRKDLSGPVTEIRKRTLRLILAVRAVKARIPCHHRALVAVIDLTQGAMVIALMIVAARMTLMMRAAMKTKRRGKIKRRKVRKIRKVRKRKMRTLIPMVLQAYPVWSVLRRLTG